MSGFPNKLEIPLTIKDKDGNVIEIQRITYFLERTCHINELDALTQTLSMANGCAWGECSECGGLTPTDSVFCVECGAKVVTDGQ